MSSDQIRKQLAAVRTPFWVVLASDEQIPCQSLISFDGLVLSVVVGLDTPRSLAASDIRAILQGPLFSEL